jgi:hypothetical protein
LYKRFISQKQIVVKKKFHGKKRFLPFPFHLHCGPATDEIFLVAGREDKEEWSLSPSLAYPSFPSSPFPPYLRGIDTLFDLLNLQHKELSSVITYLAPVLISAFAPSLVSRFQKEKKELNFEL